MIRDDVTPVTQDPRSTPEPWSTGYRSSNPMLTPAPITVETVLLAQRLVSGKGIQWLDSVDIMMAEIEHGGAL